VTNKVLFITGGASGIGLEIARKFSSEGYQVMVTDLDEQTLAEVKEQFNCETCVCDVSDELQITNAVEKTINLFGHIDVLINNAGLQHIAKVEEFPSDKFEKLIKVMLIAPFLLTKYVMPHMKKRKTGHILNMASINGLIGFAGKAGYNSAKHGVIGLTKVTALEGAAFGVRVNALCPGYVDTPLVRNQLGDLANDRGISIEKVLEEVIYPLVPQKRLIDPEEIADYALFLSSEKAKSVTGQAVVMDGGYTAQ
jgi:3-hydroxybutyrate dehydrogenase